MQNHILYIYNIYITTLIWTRTRALRSCPFFCSWQLDKVILVLAWLEHSFLILISHSLPPCPHYFSISLQGFGTCLPPTSKSHSCHYSEFVRLSLKSASRPSLPPCSTVIFRSLHLSCWLVQLTLFFVYNSSLFAPSAPESQPGTYQFFYSPHLALSQKQTYEHYLVFSVYSIQENSRPD